MIVFGCMTMTIPPPLYKKVCKKYTKNLHEAEDLTQNIFLKLMNKIDTFKGKSPAQFTSWLKMLSKNSVIDSIRKRQNIYDISEHELNGLNLDFKGIGTNY